MGAGSSGGHHQDYWVGLSRAGCCNSYSGDPQSRQNLESIQPAGDVCVFFINPSTHTGAAGSQFGALKTLQL